MKSYGLLTLTRNRFFVNDYRLTKAKGVGNNFFIKSINKKLIMNQPIHSFSKDVIINNPLGLHARAAAKIASLVKTVKSNVWIIKDGEKVDASSVIEILTLACAKGSKITIAIEDESDLDILNDLVQLVQSGFGE